MALGLGSVVGATPAKQAAGILRSAEGPFIIDCNRLPVGQRVSQVVLNQGVSGSGIGSVLLGIDGEDAVRVDAQRRGRKGDSNRAMTFDGECRGDPEDCSGNDGDLYNPGQGRNLLIVSQDNNPDDPNDNHGGEHIDFDFSGFGPGRVSVTGLEVATLVGGVLVIYLAPWWRSLLWRLPEARQRALQTVHLAVLPLFVLGVSRLSAQSFSPFLYFQF